VSDDHEDIGWPTPEEEAAMNRAADKTHASLIREKIREELDEIAADIEGYKYDLAEARKSLYAARARRAELKAKLAELKAKGAK
jgi:hypothetical protein